LLFYFNILKPSDCECWDDVPEVKPVHLSTDEQASSWWVGFHWFVCDLTGVLSFQKCRSFALFYCSGFFKMFAKFKEFGW